jgi:hypothetical protein
MRRIVATALVIGMAAAGAASAQTAPSTSSNSNQSTTGTSTVPGSSPQTAAAPVAGANSFTESQARSRIEDSGYADVTGLAKDDQGIWRGKAMKGGSSVDVSIDFQGNVVAGQH